MIDATKHSCRVALVAVLATAATLFAPHSVAQNERTTGTIVGGAVGSVVGGGRGMGAGGVAGNLVGVVVKNERQQGELAAADAQTRTNGASSGAKEAAAAAFSRRRDDAAPSPAV